MKLRVWDQWLLWSSLAAVVLLAWIYLYSISQNMMGMDMSEMDMGVSPAWSMRDFILMFIMWAVMMVGMMVPTALRAISIYARVAETAITRGSPLASIYWFISGYITIWTGFSIGATFLHTVLQSASLLSATMVSSNSILGAALLIAAGVYQLTPWKDVCLKHCQSPAAYLAGRFGPHWSDGFGLGLRHGAYCLGCCWMLMLLLFVGGVMNFLLIAAITGFVLLEKLIVARYYLTRIVAGGMIAAGLFVLFN